MRTAKKALSLLLTLAMVLGMFSVPAAAENETITLSVAFSVVTWDDDDNEIRTPTTSAQSDDYVYATVSFTGGSLARPFGNYNLFVHYDDSLQPDSVVTKELTKPTYNAVNGTALLGFADNAGLTYETGKNKGKGITNGALFTIGFTANADIDNLENAIYLLESAETQSGLAVAKIKDVDGDEFILAGIPMVMGELTLDPASVTVNGNLAEEAVTSTPSLASTGGSAIALDDVSIEITKGEDAFEWFDNGTITVPNDAVAGDYTVTAMPSGEGLNGTATATLTVARAASVPASTSASENSVDLPAKGANGAELTLSTIDQFGDEIDADDVDYALKDSSIKGVTFDGDTVTVTNDAKDNTFENDELTVEYTATANDASAEGSFTVKRADSVPTSLEITEGSESVIVPGVDEEAKTSDEFIATVFDQYGAEMKNVAVTWSLDRDFDGVSIADGVITVTNEAMADIKTTSGTPFTVTATVKDTTVKDSVDNIYVKRAAAALAKIEVEVVGDKQNAYVPYDADTTDDTSTFTATLTDQYGNGISGDVTWAISPQIDGVTIDNGTVTVKNAAKTNITDGTEFTVTATSGDVSGEAKLTVARKASAAATVVISKDSVEVTTDTLSIPASGEKSATYTAKVFGQYGEDMPNAEITWTLAAADNYVSNEDGVVTVKAGATKNNTYTLTAKSGDASDSVEITIVDISITWPDAEVKEAPTYGDKWGELVTLKDGGYAKIEEAIVEGTFSLVYGVSGTEQGAKTADDVPDSGEQVYDIVFKSTDGAYTVYQKSEDAKFTVAPAALTVTANANTITYGDEPAANGVTYDGFVNGDDAEDLEGTLTYTFSYEQGGNIGDDYAITPAGLSGSNYTIEFVPGTLTVEAKPITVSGIVATDKTYDGKPDAELDCANAAFAGKLENDALTVTATGAFEDANAGENKKVAISGITLGGDKAGNYVLADEGQQTEASATISPLEAELAWSGAGERDYDGTASAVTATVSNLVEGDQCDVTVTDGDKVDAGEYTATASALSNDNYKLPEAVTQSYKINQISSATEAVPEFTLKSREAAPNEAQTLEIVLDDVIKYTAEQGGKLHGKALYGELEFKNGGFLSGFAAYNQDQTKLVITVPAGEAKLDGTSESVKIPVTTTNFVVEPVELTVVFKNKLDVSDDIAFGEEQYEVTYGDDCEITASYNHGDTQKELDPATFTYEGTGDTEYQASSTMPTEVGTYTVTVKYDDDVPEGDLFGHTGTATATLTIKPLVAELEWTNAGSRIYNGEAVVVSAKVKNALEGDDVTVMVKTQDSEASESITETNATNGNVTVSFAALAGEDAKNYGDPTANLSAVFAITPKDISVDKVTLADETRLYDGTTDVGEYTIVLKDVESADEGKLTATAASAQWTAADVGTKQIKLTGVELSDAENASGASANYRISSDWTVDANIEITKAENSWKIDDEQNQLLPSIAGWTYGEEPSEQEFAGEPTFGTVTLTWAKGGTALDAKPDASSDAGVYTMTATVAETDNYAGLTETVEFEIAKAKREIKVDPEALTVYADGGAITVTFADKDSSGALKATQSVVSALSLTNEKKDGSVVYTITPLTDSESTITFSIDATTNYEADEASATVKVILTPLASVAATATYTEGEETKTDDKAELTAAVDGDKIVVTGYKTVADAEIVVEPTAVEGLTAAVEDGKVVVKDADGNEIKSYEIDDSGVTVLETTTEGDLELNDKPSETTATGTAAGTDVQVNNVSGAAATELAEDAADLEEQKKDDIASKGFANGYTLDVETKVKVEAKSGATDSEMKLTFTATYTVTAVANDANGDKIEEPTEEQKLALTETAKPITKLENKVKVEVKLPNGFIPTIIKRMVDGVQKELFNFTLGTSGDGSQTATWEQGDFDGEVLLIADNRYGTITFLSIDGDILSTADYTVNNIGDAFPELPVVSNKVAQGWVMDGETATVSSLTDELLTKLNETHALTLTASYKDKTTGGGGSGSGGGTSTPSETVKVDDASNGSVTVSDPKAKAGETVTIAPKADKGYKLDDLIVKDSKGKLVPVTKNDNGTYSFTMPASGGVTITPKFTESTSPKYIDVPENSFYADAVEWASDNFITNGTSANTFSPDKACTRAEAVTFLYRAAGSPEVEVTADFSDVSADAYYAKAVSWAVANGITNGTGNGKFSPNQTCTRAQIVTFLYRYANGLPASNSFVDVPTDAYYASAVGWAVANGITKGTGNGTTFSPNAVCTRSQIVTFLYRAFNK